MYTFYEDISNKNLNNKHAVLYLLNMSIKKHLQVSDIKLFQMLNNVWVVTGVYHII